MHDGQLYTINFSDEIMKTYQGEMLSFKKKQHHQIYPLTLFKIVNLCAFNGVKK
jgi:hypothetical protein